MIDSRVLRVLAKLDSLKVPRQSTEIYQEADANITVVGTALRSARELGLSEYERINSRRYWHVTDKGRDALRAAAT